MKGSLSNASAIVQGLKGWVTRRQPAALSDVETSEPEVVAAGGCEDPPRPFAEERDRWPLGPGVDNYS